jgi:CRP-like cAMP-binding protein
MIEARALEKMGKYALFGGLEDEQIAHLLPLMVLKEFQTGEDILKEGVFNDSVYFLLSGKVSVSKNGVALAELREGDAFGEMEFIEIVPTVATITAQSPVSTLSLSNKNLHTVYKTDTAAFALIVMNLARELSRRLRRMDIKAVGADAE